MTDWQQPLVSVDVVALRWDGASLRVGIHTRANAPFAGREALPGVLLLPGETLAAAAERAVTSKLGVTANRIALITQFGAFDGTNRDPRGATISIGHFAVLRDESADERADGTARWVAEAEGLPFDHDAILATALDELALRLWRDWPLTRALLGEEFTTKGALALSRRLDALPNRASNLARWLEATGRVERVGLRGRDSVWAWG